MGVWSGYKKTAAETEEVSAAVVCCSDASKLDLIYINTYNEITFLRGF